MNFTDRLFEGSKEIWMGYIEHPFIQGIIDGSLEKEKFERYLVQDYLYLKEYAKVFAMGVVKAETMEEMKFFYNSVKGTMEDENELHIRILKENGYKIEDVEKMKEYLDNTSYTSYMNAIASKDGIKEIAAAILPCTWSYNFIGKYIIENHSDKINGNPYKEWIELYGDAGFTEFTDKWIDYTNKLCNDISEEDKLNLINIFVNCSIYEMKFWDMAYGEVNKDELLRENEIISCN
ncbi:thiaminase II [uncultured Clostridium sp.]|jgi:thiaminase/transcriptional activator TenA|uniref:thiaminase II n=1 Tax=uncultured Clostridium sp. TaxID=59620 RepID=UPI00262F405B|nr:thiaminase II [uncultured Clostridium sp.]